MKIFSSISIRLKLIVIMLAIGLLPFLVAGIYLYSTTSRQMTAQIEQSMQLVAHDIAQSAQDRFNEKIEVLDIFVFLNKEIQKGLTEAAESWKTLGSDGEILSEISRRDTLWSSSVINNDLMNSIQSHSLSKLLLEFMAIESDRSGYEVFGEIFITDKYGANVYQTNKTSDYYQADEDWWVEARSEGIHVGEIEYDDSANLLGRAVALPVRTKDGNFLGVVKAFIGLSYLEPLLNEYAQIIQPPSSITLTDAAGVVHYSTVAGLSKGDTFTLFDVSKAITEKQGSLELPSGYHSSAEEIVSFGAPADQARYAPLDIHLFIEQQKNDTLTSINEALQRQLVIGLVLIVIICTVSIIFAGTITKPLLNLTNTINEISKGKLDAQVDNTDRQDEIGELARAFDRTVVSLKLAMRDQADKSNES